MDNNVQTTDITFTRTHSTPAELLVTPILFCVSRTFPVHAQKAEMYADSHYNANANATLRASCIIVCERSQITSPILPFFQTPRPYLSYLQSNASKTFQRCTIDVLEVPEIVSTMLLPGQARIGTHRAFIPIFHLFPPCS